MAVVTPLNNFLGPEGDTVTVDEQLLNTQYSTFQHGRGGPMHGEFLRHGLLFLQAHRRLRHTSLPLECHRKTPTRKHLLFKRAAFYNGRTDSCQGSSIAGQPQCPRLCHNSNPNARSLSHSPSASPPSFTQSPYPPCSLVRDAHNGSEHGSVTTCVPVVQGSVAGD